MKETHSAEIGAQHAIVAYDEPEICPLCKHAIKPETLSFGGYKSTSNGTRAYALYLCKHCYEVFVSFFSCSPTTQPNRYTANLLYSEPNRFAARVFDQHIADVSPSFVKIYNQANAAECSGLDEIAGIGYRKALEFLIKDFLIHEAPDDEETIKKMDLGNCIANRVSYDKLQIVASRSAWLGNDFAHYVQKFEGKDIEDMKRFIDAVVYWISMELITDEAALMSK